MTPTSEFHIFRDSRRSVSAAELLARLRREVSQLNSSVQQDQLLRLLLLAGELECALEDAAAADSARAAELTSLFADAVVTGDSPGGSLDVLTLADATGKILQQIQYADVVSVGTPEGFAYYALHPLDYADLMAKTKPDCSRALVIGIRTIGTTLGAMVCAKLRQIGVLAERTTVRPTGHPYDRTCSFSPQQRNAIVRALGSGAQFVVCDEGPGRSGSSLLCVAEALEREGVPVEHIVILCSHQPDISALCAPNAAKRWLRYRSEPIGATQRLPAGAREYAGGGEWRRVLVAPGRPWPALWPQLERLKFLSANHSALFTFEGYGPHGSAVSARNAALSAAGFGARYLGHEVGFGGHALPPGRLACRDDLTAALLTRMAEYCAWRANACRESSTDLQALEQMARINLEREFGNSPDDLRLCVERPTVCDNRMAPHYWWLTAEGVFFKLDAAIHGDDHFFPGPCDIAWDLAGIVVEWKLSSSERDFLLCQYRRASRDDPAPRIHNYELAYAVFRMAWSKMAAASVGDSEEEARLLHDYRRYRRWVVRISGCRTPQSRRPPAAARPREAQERSVAPGLP